MIEERFCWDSILDAGASVNDMLFGAVGFVGVHDASPVSPGAASPVVGA